MAESSAAGSADPCRVAGSRKRSAEEAFSAATFNVGALQPDSHSKEPTFRTKLQRDITALVREHHVVGLQELNED